jgi:hypothetical protein
MTEHMVPGSFHAYEIPLAFSFVDCVDSGVFADIRCAHPT